MIKELGAGSFGVVKLALLNETEENFVRQLSHLVGNQSLQQGYTKKAERLCEERG